MKKFFKRTLGISSVLILGYQQFCYADVISTSPTEIYRCNYFNYICNFFFQFESNCKKTEYSWL